MENVLLKKKKELYGHLFKYHRGKENAISCCQLAIRFRLDDKTVRSLVSKLRKEGVPICSCQYGYFYPGSYSDVIEVVGKFSKYLTTLSATSSNLLKSTVLS